MAINNMNKNKGVQGHPPVSIKEEALYGYPLVSLNEADFEVEKGYVFSTLTYHRPAGPSKRGVAEVELISPYGDVQTHNVELVFSSTEDQRKEDAKRKESFSIRQEVLITRDPSNITPLDISNRYEDVVIHAVKFIPIGSSTAEGDFKVDYYFVDEEKEKASRIETIMIPITFKAGDATIDSSALNADAKYANLDSDDKAVSEGLTLTVADLKNFKISEAFLNGAPPIVPEDDFIIPNDGVRFRKVDYFPPKTVDSKLAHVNVEYILKDRIYSERVAFEFSKSISYAAQVVVKSIPLSEIQYQRTDRKVAPTFMRVGDFEYIGDLPIEITDIVYSFNNIDPDDRYVTVGIILVYRTVPVRINKRLEFQFSKNEYIHGNWSSARTENGSIKFDPKFKKPEIIKAIAEGDKNLNRELVRKATIVEGYPYESIDDIKVINFNKVSRLAMFKITATEMVGKLPVKRQFEKQVELVESFEEFTLNKITEKDLEVNYDILPPYPPDELLERVIKSHPDYSVISIQYVRPPVNVRKLDVQVKIAAGRKTKFLTKTIEWPISKIEYERQLWDRESEEYLEKLDPSIISINLDIFGEPVRRITKEDIIGIPDVIDYQIDYVPPVQGSKSTRLKLKIWKGSKSIVFEQSLHFKLPRTW